MTCSLIAVVALLSQPADPVDEFLTMLAERRKDVHVLEAQFLMENIMPDETARSVGTLLYVRPRRVVFRILDPESATDELVILIDQSRVYEYDVELEQVQVYDRDSAADMEALFAAFESDPDDMREAYDVELFEPGPDNPKARHGFVLRPKENEDPQPRLFERARLFLRGDDLLPTKIHIVNDAESQVILEFDNCHVNRAIDPAATQLHIPKGVTVVENEQIVTKVGRKGMHVPEPIVPRIPSPKEPPGATEDQGPGAPSPQEKGDEEKPGNKGVIMSTGASETS